MMKSKLIGLVTSLMMFGVALLGCVPSALAAPFNYFDDFNAGVNSNWSFTGTSTGAVGILGQLGSTGTQTATLTLSVPESSDGLLAFDLLGFGTIDGGHHYAGQYYTDIFDLTINGTKVFSGAFVMGGEGSNEIYAIPPGGTSTTTSYGGWWDPPHSGGLTQVSVPFLLQTGTNTFEFQYGPNLQGLGDESWGLDNVSVRATPLPSTWFMLLSGFVGLGYIAYRGTKKHSAVLAA
jgi:hypothetical protein